jgi:hypothetical protein
MTPRDVVATFERGSECVLVEVPSTLNGSITRTLRFETQAVRLPLFDNATATRLEFFTSFSEVTTPERPVAFVQSLDVLDSLKRTPRREGCSRT